MSGKNGNGVPPGDKVGAAIAAANQPTDQQLVTWGPVKIASTGRFAVIGLPPDATDGEIGELAGWLLTSVMNTHRAQRAKTAAGGLLVPPPGTIVRA